MKAELGECWGMYGWCHFRGVRIYILYLRHVKMWRDVFCILDFILHLSFFSHWLRRGKQKEKKNPKQSQTLNLGMPIFIPGISVFQMVISNLFPIWQDFLLPFSLLRWCDMMRIRNTYPCGWGGDYLAGYCFFSSCCLHGDVLAAFTSLYVLQWCHSKNLIFLASPLKVLKNCHCASLRQWETGYTMVWLNHDVIMCPKYR